ncbi:MAG: FadR family transcriptional regulator [Acetobacteraceae bacterium]|nr:FadR family transcriptional regulator [Acetobacteraceae bacterium]
MEVKPVVRSTLPDAIIEQVKRLVLDGKLRPGDRLPSERELGEKFSVGRTSIREALKALASIGLIKRTREGTFVNDETVLKEPLAFQLLLKRTTVEEVFETRKLFEVGLAELAARRITDEDLEVMLEALQGDDAGVDAFVRSDVAFHQAIADAAQNAVLHELYVAVRELLFQSHSFYEAFQDQEQQDRVRRIINQARADHRQLIEAFRAQDAAMARQIMYDHLDNIEKELLALR